MSNEVVEKKPEIVTVGRSSMGDLIAVIDKAVKDPSVDPARITQFVELAERLHEREARMQFNDAMLAAQAEIKPVATNKANDQTKSRYADLPQLDKLLRPIYSKHGFSLSYDTEPSPNPQSVVVLCYVSHRGGFEKTYSIDMPADGKGPKGNDVMSRTHATGAAMTYGRRYLLLDIFNIPVGDDDGNAAEGGPNSPITARELNTLSEMVEKFDKWAAEKGVAKLDVPALLKFYKVENLVDLTRKQFSNAVEKINGKYAQPEGKKK